jgi:hypothetical protein
VRSALAAFAALACALSLPAAAGAIGITASPTSASTSTTLNGLDQEPTFSVAVTMTGANTSGWRITAWAPAPSTGGRTLPALEVPSQPAADTCTGGGCTQPSPTGISWPVTLGTTAASAAKIYNANVNTGKGNDVVHVTFGVKVPSNVLSGTYTTSITLTITNTGP